jgi:uncharacterized membrane protein YedE/YeeE/rhodanese-related sulfurtransferase
MSAVFPVAFASEELYLLTAVGLGFLFGFALERAGFANARKLAAQFYLYDMTVFKVMFTAILVAMVGLYTLAGVGLVDLSILWINPTFLWAQVIGGLLLGVGFIMSGLCPGTSVVSAVSGRYDGAVTLAGIFVGTALFSIAVDWFPAIERLYDAGGEISLLPALLGLPTPAVVLGVVVMAALAFVGAEQVERRFRAKHPTVELTPAPTPRTPRIKFALAGSLAAVVLVSAAWKAPAAPPAPPPMTAIEPLDLAQSIIASDPNVMVFDLRTDRSEAGIPGAFAVDDGAAASLLEGMAPSVRVVVYDESGLRREAPTTWPQTLRYSYVRGGLAAWTAEVTTPMEPTGYGLADRERLERQHQIAAYFSGTAVTTAAPPPPPAMTSGTSAGKKRKGGC